MRLLKTTSEFRYIVVYVLFETLRMSGLKGSGADHAVWSQTNAPLGGIFKRRTLANPCSKWL